MRAEKVLLAAATAAIAWTEDEDSWEGRSSTGSLRPGLFSLGDSPLRELAFSSATSTSKSLARPWTSRRWCTEWI